MSICAVGNCARNSVTKVGYCVMHYKRWKRNGTPETTLSKYTKEDVCEECFETYPPYRNGVCNPCRVRLYRKGYSERDIAIAGSGTITTAGYRLLTINKKRIYEHRHIMSKHLGRELTDEETIHHIDGDRGNNSISNLKLFANQSEHMKHHRQEST